MKLKVKNGSEEDYDNSNYLLFEHSSREEDVGKKQKLPRFNAAKDMENPEFKARMIFRDTYELKKAIINYAVKWGKDIHFNKNERWRVSAI